MDKVKFNFEDLEVWQKAVEFANKVIKLITKSQELSLSAEALCEGGPVRRSY